MDTKCNTVSSEVVNLDKKFEKLKEPNIKLVKRVKDLESNQGTTSADIEKLQDDVDEVESYSRRSCLIFSNIPNNTTKSDEEQVLDMMYSKLQSTLLF